MTPRQRLRAFALVLACLSAGCLATTRDHLFSGRAVTHVGTSTAGGRQGGETLDVQGWVVSDWKSQALSLTFSNQSDRFIPMSALVDEYTVKTTDGRVVTIKVGDFLSYPDGLKPAEERSVTLAVPDDLPPAQIAQVTARLDQGRVVAVLRSIGPKEPPAWRVGTPSPIVVTQPAAQMRMDAAHPPVERAPIAVDPVGPVAPRSEAPTGTVPVIVEFHQVLGSALRAEVFWNDSDKRVTLATGERQLFYMVPGQHELHVVSRVPFIVETNARAPVVVSATAPIKVDVNATARFSGVELRVRVWHGDRQTLDQTFAPISKSPG